MSSRKASKVGQVNVLSQIIKGHHTSVPFFHLYSQTHLLTEINPFINNNLCYEIKIRTYS